MNLLEINDLHVSFAGQPAVSGVTLSIAPGERLAVVGESGSGKSVTASAILGLLPARGCSVSGSVRFAGQPLLGLPERTLNAVRGRGIGMIFQNPLSALDPSFRIGQLLRENLRHKRGLRGAQAQAEALYWLQQVGIEDGARVLQAYPHQLSGGMRQRVMIALALLGRPRLLIADEPTTALDATVQRQILDLLLALSRRHGTAILIITHDFGVVARLSERVAVMRQGQVMEQGPTQQILAAPRHAYTRSLVQAVPTLGAAPQRPPAPRAGPALLQLRGLSKTFSLGGGWLRKTHTLAAVQGVDLQLHAGETLGLIGESGSGKSTLARLVAQLTPATAGEVRFDGQPVSVATTAQRRAFCRQVQYVFQDSSASLNPRRTIAEQLIAPALRLGLAANAEDALARAVQLLEQVNLGSEYLQRYPHTLSGGQRQRVGIARALMAKPRLIILDEPTSALDVSLQAQILDLLGELRQRLGLTYLLIGHSLPVIERFCDRVAVMQRGRIVETLAAGDLQAHARHPYTQQLLAAVLPLGSALPTLGQATPA